jgi:choice-of-anchor B domain-containing protein
MDEIGGGIAVGTGRGSGGWGWEDPATGREYAIVGRSHNIVINERDGVRVRARDAGGDYSVAIVDVTDKANPVILSVNTYPNARYAHQGWLTEDQRYFLFGDELDEQAFGHNTNTFVWDVQDLTAARLIGIHFGPTTAIDHNMYVKNRYVYQSNYSAGLYVLDLRDVAEGRLEQVGYFDVYPPHDNAVFGFGTWGQLPVLPQRGRRGPRLPGRPVREAARRPEETVGC